MPHSNGGGHIQLSLFLTSVNGGSLSTLCHDTDLTDSRSNKPSDVFGGSHGLDFIHGAGGGLD
jgi:hypothetical protein